MKRRRSTVGVNAAGRRVGQYHPGATLTDNEVDYIRDLYEEGFHSYGQLAKMFDVSKSCIAGIVKFQRRGQRVEIWRGAREPGGKD